jgi:hypothetical protein
LGGKWQIQKFGFEKSEFKNENVRYRTNMPLLEYRCNRCWYSTGNRQTFKKHLERKTACPAVHSTMTQQEMLNALGENIRTRTTTHMCPFCKCHFSSYASKSNHKKICRMKDTPIVDSDQEPSSNMIEEMREVRERLRMLERRLYDASNNNVISNNSNNNIINFNITSMRAFGDENINCFTQEIINKLIKGEFTENLTKHIHCNNDYPENMNVLVNSKKSDDALVYDGERYATVKKMDIYLKRLVVYKQLMADLIQQYEIPRAQRNDIKNLIGGFESIINEGHNKYVLSDDDNDSEDTECVKNLIEKINNLFYDARDDVRKVKKAFDKHKQRGYNQRLFGNA